jgi:ADP-ribose pyrophosphatase
MEERLSRQTPFTGRTMTVHVDTVRTDSGAHSVREVLEHPGSVVVIPRRAGRVLLVRQYRYAVERELLELPAGTLDPGESVEAAAHRELAEETGTVAGTLRRLGSFYPSPGYSTEIMHIFLAENLTESADAEADADEELEVVELDWNEALGMARQASFDDMKTTLGILLAAEADL